MTKLSRDTRTTVARVVHFLPWMKAVRRCSIGATASVQTPSDARSCNIANRRRTPECCQIKKWADRAFENE